MEPKHDIYDMQDEGDLLFDEFPMGRKLRAALLAGCIGWIILGGVALLAWEIYHAR